MNTTLLIKLDKKLKVEAQKTAASLGLPMSTVISNYLRNFVVAKEVTFSEPELNAKTIRLIKQARKEHKEGKSIGPFKTADAFMESLNS